MTADNKKLVKGTCLGALQGLLSNVPVLGAAAVEAWQGYLGARQAAFIQDIQDRLEGVEQKKLDLDYIESEEFFDLFSRGLRARMLCRSTEKAALIADIIVDSMMTDRDVDVETQTKEIFLNQIEHLTDPEITFLRDYIAGKYQGKSKNDVYQGGDDSAAIALDALMAKGILREGDTWEKKIADSMLGRDLIVYLKTLRKKPS